MSTGKLSHLQINVHAANLPFYKDLFRVFHLGTDLFR